MADEELFDEFEARELETMNILLRSKASKSAITIDEFINLRLSQGASQDSIRDALLRDLREGGRIFGEFRSSIKATARGSINRVRDNSIYSEYGVDRQYRWVAVLVRTCPDCLENHGSVKTWDEWEQSRFGLPRSGGTICRENCRCVLVISEATEIQPLVRKGGKIVDPRTGQLIAPVVR